MYARGLGHNTDRCSKIVREQSGTWSCFSESRARASSAATAAGVTVPPMTKASATPAISPMLCHSASELRRDSSSACGAALSLVNDHHSQNRLLRNRAL